MKTADIIKAIHPSIKPSYSPNLHAFAKRYGSRDPMQMWRENECGTLWIGYMDLQHADSNNCRGLIGNRLNTVLCYGSNALKNRGWWSVLGPGNMTHIPDFWDRYIAIGRCAIDPKHTQFYINGNDRFTMAGDVRTCTWCGAQHTRRIEIQTITKEIEHFDPVAP